MAVNDVHGACGASDVVAGIERHSGVVDGFTADVTDEREYPVS